MHIFRKIGGAAIFAFALISSVLAGEKQVVVAVGDSTVSNYPADSEFRGWGQILQEWARDGVEFHNEAVSGTSSKSFLSSGKWELALKHDPTYVFIQFGHNDRAKDPDRGTQPQGEYRDNLLRFIREVRAQGAQPILITSPVPRAFNLKTGKLGHGRLEPYVETMHEVGKTENVPVLALHEKSFAWYAAVGENGARESAPKPGDINHYNRAGAEILAGFVLEELREKAPTVAELFLAPQPSAARFPDDQRGGQAN